MRRGFGILGLVATVILLAIVGVVAYNIGWSDGVSTHLPAATGGAPAYYYYHGPHYWGVGFGFFGILWFLLIVFGIFWLFRLLFWGFMGRRMWMGGWGYGRGYPGRSFEERAQDWHRRQHGEQPPPGSGPPPPPPGPPPPDSRSL